jgi:glycosyltransferase involved in cell wall biosynthesis
MSDSVVMTVHDRDPEVLMACLRSLARGKLADAQIIVVNDRSELDYAPWLAPYGRERFADFKIIDTGDYEGFRLNGYGNPSHAFNVGLANAEGDRVFLMSSDVIVSQKSQERASRDELWTCRIVDTDTSAEYCGPSRYFPMPWFLAAPRKALMEIGGWDEGYLAGLCFEDNDLLGRLGLHCGIVLGDWSVTSYHLSHFQPAYQADDKEVVAANRVNQEYTLNKWDGIPFDGERTPFDVIRKPHPSGCYCMKFSMDADKLRSVMLKSKGTIRDLGSVPV